jgi:hypothetical protein
MKMDLFLRINYMRIVRRWREREWTRIAKGHVCFVCGCSTCLVLSSLAVADRPCCSQFVCVENGQTGQIPIPAGGMWRSSVTMTAGGLEPGAARL